MTRPPNLDNATAIADLEAQLDAQLEHGRRLNRAMVLHLLGFLAFVLAATALDYQGLLPWPGTTVLLALYTIAIALMPWPKAPDDERPR